MQATSDTVLKILQVLLPILLGLAFRLCGVFGEAEGGVLRRVVLRLSVPVLVFFSMYDALGQNLATVLPLTACFILLTLILFGLGWVASGLVSGTGRKTAVHACITFGNYGWLGYGVAKVLQGDVGLQRAVFFILLWWPVFYLFGLPIGLIHTRVRKGGMPVGKVLKIVLPTLGAAGLGLLLNACGQPGPDWLKGLLGSVFRPFARMSVPLILFGVGLMLDIKGMHRAVGPALLVSAATLIVAPFIGWELAALITRDSVSYSVVILDAAMPVATLTVVLAEYYEMDTGVVTTALGLSTFLSMLTLPVVALLIS